MDKIFTRKLLEDDFTGNAIRFHCSFTVEKDGQTEEFGSVCVLGHDDLKPKSEWTESEIDAKAEWMFSLYSEESLNAVFDDEEKMEKK
jgi:hypothetical protein